MKTQILTYENQLHCRLLGIFLAFAMAVRAGRRPAHEFLVHDLCRPIRAHLHQRRLTQTNGISQYDLDERHDDPDAAGILRRAGSLFVEQLGLYPQHRAGQSCDGAVVSQRAAHAAVSELAGESKNALPHPAQSNGAGDKNRERRRRRSAISWTAWRCSTVGTPTPGAPFPTPTRKTSPAIGTATRM